ncbi:hypothetical protein MSHOH_2179 [Methanosarcina horonobensis HB-1 = JCM 15518]|uniref:Uncharacterized protein n=1 Tax=Methanosarcina horonobensis HB-1 = JCM 15518 TaxID=1434110 RepID=A0A0E3SEP6_9EURY|nr:hypothetical protein MSHOH_2179 [Methanosarcina horonobensis HB-1 = JCM 15518]
MISGEEAEPDTAIESDVFPGSDAFSESDVSARSDALAEPDASAGDASSSKPMIIPARTFVFMPFISVHSWPDT